MYHIRKKVFLLKKYLDDLYEKCRKRYSVEVSEKIEMIEEHIENCNLRLCILEKLQGKFFT